MVIADTNYSMAIENIEKVKNDLEQLDKTVYSHLPQGITIGYDKYRDSLINWLEEMECEISNYKICNCLLHC